MYAIIKLQRIHRKFQQISLFLSDIWLFLPEPTFKKKVLHFDEKTYNSPRLFSFRFFSL